MYIYSVLVITFKKKSISQPGNRMHPNAQIPQRFRHNFFDQEQPKREPKNFKTRLLINVPN